MLTPGTRSYRNGKFKAQNSLCVKALNSAFILEYVPKKIGENIKMWKWKFSWSREVSSKNGQDSQSRETEGGEKIAGTSWISSYLSFIRFQI